MTRRIATVAVAMILAALPASAGQAAPSPAGADAVAISTIRIAAFTFYPNNPRVDPGAEVTVINLDGRFFGVPHTLTAFNGSFDTGVLVEEPGSFTAPTEPGRYPFLCVIHPQMLGLLVVRG